MRAFSLRTLLIATAVIALGLVILGRPSLFWMRVALTGTLATLGWWLVLALATRDERRRFGVAAAIIGIGYLSIAFHSTERQQFQNNYYVLGRMLITHQLLEGAATLSGRGYPTTVQDISLWDSQMFSEVTYIAVPVTGGAAPAVTSPGGFGGGLGGGGFGGGGMAPGQFAFRTVPGATPNARYQHYLISGHCLFAVLFGWIAGSAARRWLGPGGGSEGGVGGPR